MPKPEFEFFDPLVADDVSWVPVEGLDGVSEKILSRDAETGDYTRLLRFAPGADSLAQGTFRHDFWEEVWIVDGALHDVRLGKTFTKGMYACRPPGMPHGPWRSTNGVLTFEIRYRLSHSDSE